MASRCRPAPPEVTGQVRIDPTEPLLVGQTLGDRFGIPEAHADPDILSEGQERVAQVEPEIDGEGHRCCALR
jgi:hypothetical protein